MPGELHDLLVAVGQGVDQNLQVLHRPEQVFAGITEPAGNLGELMQRGVERFSIAVESVRGLVDGPAQRALRLPGHRAELSRQCRQRLFDFVPFDRHPGPV